MRTQEGWSGGGQRDTVSKAVGEAEPAVPRAPIPARRSVGQR